MLTGPLNRITLPEALIAQRLLQSQPSGMETYAELQAVKGGGRCAAVLIPFVHTEDGWHLLFIRRAETVQSHKGQVAFPGGGCEAEDKNLEGTALRETEEEVGVSARDIRILGRLPTLLTVTDFMVTPVVGTFQWPYPLKLCTDEVSRAFTIPLAWLADPGHREEKLYSRKGHDVPVTYFQPYDGEVLWGASAWMTLELLICLGLK